GIAVLAFSILILFGLAAIRGIFVVVARNVTVAFCSLVFRFIGFLVGGFLGIRLAPVALIHRVVRIVIVFLIIVFLGIVWIAFVIFLSLLIAGLLRVLGALVVLVVWLGVLVGLILLAFAWFILLGTVWIFVVSLAVFF